MPEHVDYRHPVRCAACSRAFTWEGLVIFKHEESGPIRVGGVVCPACEAEQVIELPNPWKRARASAEAR